MVEKIKKFIVTIYTNKMQTFSVTQLWEVQSA